MERRTPHETRQVFVNEFNKIIKASGLTYDHIIDIDIGSRTLSCQFNERNKGRYYFRYSLLVEYLYDGQNSESLTSIRSLKVDPSTFGLVPYVDPVVYFHKLLTLDIPWLFRSFKSVFFYKVVYINSYYPFDEEAHETIYQDTELGDSYTVPPPRLHHYGFAVVDVTNCHTELVVRCILRKFGGRIRGCTIDKFKEGSFENFESGSELLSKIDSNRKRPSTALLQDDDGICEIENETS